MEKAAKELFAGCGRRWNPLFMLILHYETTDPSTNDPMRAIKDIPYRLDSTNTSFPNKLPNQMDSNSSYGICRRCTNGD